jgi:hypothetical protein
LSYERDRYAKSKYNKARKGWRTEKHKARRSYRQDHQHQAKDNGLLAKGGTDCFTEGLRAKFHIDFDNANAELCRAD